ncbi:MAG TPA: replication-associated recombination protein A [Acidimicrobiales bacterium]|nr:replication-associated recombination protein A [Acidimicrobiales bacterium]
MARKPNSDLFEAAAAEELSRRAPLATRMRPATLAEFVGQRHLVGPGATLRALIEADRLSSAVFFGPAGSGKTTLARIVAARSAKAFLQLSATSAGVKDIRDALEEARRQLGTTGRGTILFLDEIHRFSRAQQDALLPGVEEGVVVLIGATAENPFFSLTSPLLSRSTLWRFEPIGREDLAELGRRAVDLEHAEIEPDGLEACCDLADGDARAMVTTLEIAIAVARARADAALVIGRDDVEAARTTRALRHGRDAHYDLISALIKSVRGSDPDAGVYWLARLLAAGEDPRFVARRLVILSSEDVGLADPLALVVAEAAAAALDRVGLPEAALNLAEAVVYLATAPKSNRTAAAIWAAQSDVENGPLGAVPAALRGANYPGAESLGHGVGYEYPHDDPRGWVAADYLPAELVGRHYYEPSDRGAEAGIAERLAILRSLHDDAASGGQDKENRAR